MKTQSTDRYRDDYEPIVREPWSCYHCDRLAPRKWITLGVILPMLGDERPDTRGVGLSPSELWQGLLRGQHASR
jgi:hypothetical protein